jgi:SSS family solute:Na+ symporter
MAFGRDGKFSLGSTGLDLGQSTIWVVLVYGLAINLQNFGIDQGYIQRYHAAPSVAEARQSVWLGGLLYLPASAIFLLIGTALFAFYAAYPDRLPMDAAARADAVFPHFIATELPVGLGGLMIAAVVAAAQSTLSTSINSSATLLLWDGYLRYVRPDASDRRKLLVLRLGSLLFGCAGIAVALAMMRVRSALDAWWQLACIFSGGLLGLFLLGWLSRRATNAHAAVAVALGVMVILWMTLSPAWPDGLAEWRSPFHGNLIIVFGTLAILTVGLGLSRLGRWSGSHRGA